MVEFPSRAVERENFSFSESRPRDIWRCLKERMGGGRYVDRRGHRGCGARQGLWSETERTWHINALELQAANFAVISFSKDHDHLHVHLKIDNSTTVAHMNKVGGTRSGVLLDLTKTLFDYALSK